MNAERRPLATLAAGGVALGTSFLSPLLWWLSLIALVPLLALVHSRTHTPRKIFWYGWVYGFSFIGTVHLWIWQTLPLSWAGAHNASWSLLLVFLCWFSVSLAQSLFIACFSAAASRLRFRNALSITLATAALWILFEYIRMWGIALFTWGEGSILSPHYSVGFLGYALAPHDLLLQLASLGGVYLLSFAAVCINGFIWWVLDTRGPDARRTVLGVTLTAFLFATAFTGTLWWNPAEGAERQIRAALFHTNFTVTTLNTPADVRVQKLNTHWSLLYKIKDSREHPDVVVIPETGRFLSSLERVQSLDSIVRESGLNSTLFIDSSRREDGGMAKGEIWYLAPGTSTPQIQEKHFLIPFGEYLPYYYATPLKLLNGERFADFSRHRNYNAGEAKRLTSATGERVGARACSEILSPSLYSDSTLAGAKILVNVASHGVFHNSKIMHYQALSIARVRAVENNRYLLRASNLSPSFVIDNRGRVVDQSLWNETGVLSSSVYLIDADSPYNTLRRTISSLL